MKLNLEDDSDCLFTALERQELAKLDQMTAGQALAVIVRIRQRLHDFEVMRLTDDQLCQLGLAVLKLAKLESKLSW
jgi:hypothetical protein